MIHYTQEDEFEDGMVRPDDMDEDDQDGGSRRNRRGRQTQRQEESPARYGKQMKEESICFNTD